MNASIRQEERYKINNLQLPLSREIIVTKTEITQMKRIKNTEINGIENYNTEEKMDDTKHLFFEKMNKTDNFSQAN